MGSTPQQTGNPLHGTQSSKSLRISDLESVYSDCGDADSSGWQQREDEFHDAPDLAESFHAHDPVIGDGIGMSAASADHENYSKTTNKGTRDLENAGDLQPNEDLHEFHDAPEMRASLEIIKTITEKEPDPPVPSALKKAPSNKSERKLRRPAKLLNEKLDSLKKDETVKKDPSTRARLSAARKGTLSNRDRHENGKGIPISQGKLANYRGVLSELKDRLNPNIKSPASTPGKFLRNRNDVLSGNVEDKKKQSVVLSSLKQKKSLHVTLDKDDNDNLPSKSEEKSDSVPVSLSLSKQPKPASAKSRLEQIKSLKQKLAICRSSSVVDKSINSLENIELQINPYSMPVIKAPLLSKKRSPELIFKKKSELSVKKETTNENSKAEECPQLMESKPDSSNFREVPTTDENILESPPVEHSDSCINTDPVTENGDEIVELRRKLEQHVQNESSLKNEYDAQRDVITRFQKREIDFKKEITLLTETLSKSKDSIREMEKKILDKDATIAMLKANVGKVQNLSEKIKLKDASLSDLHNQLTVAKKDHNDIKKDLDKCSFELNKIIKENECLKNNISQLKKEKDSLGIKITENLKKISDMEKEGSQTLKLLFEVRKQNDDLKNDLQLKAEEILDLKHKLDSKKTSSPNIVGLSEQLIEKDAIISELEKLRDGVQALNKEVCGMISSLFEDLGARRPESEIEQLITSGRILTVKNSLLALLEGQRAEEAEVSHAECRRLIFNLEDRAAILEAELEESKNYSESLAGLISSGQMWPVAGEETSKVEQRELRVAAKPRSETGDARHLQSRSHHDLYVLLEGKRQALINMERRVRELEEVHANCSQKRVRNEMRIDQLEMALAAVSFQ